MLSDLASTFVNIPVPSFVNARSSKWLQTSDVIGFFDSGVERVGDAIVVNLAAGREEGGEYQRRLRRSQVAARRGIRTTLTCGGGVPDGGRRSTQCQHTAIS